MHLEDGIVILPHALFVEGNDSCVNDNKPAKRRPHRNQKRATARALAASLMSLDGKNGGTFDGFMFRKSKLVLF